MDPQSQTMTEFEFGELSMASHRRYGAIRPVLGFFCVMFAGFMAWFVFLSRAGGGFHDSTQWLVFSTVEVTLGLLIGLFLILAWGSRQGATGLRVGEEGIVIRWRYGYEEAFPWSRRPTQSRRLLSLIATFMTRRVQRTAMQSFPCQRTAETQPRTPRSMFTPGSPGSVTRRRTAHLESVDSPRAPCGGSA